MTVNRGLAIAAAALAVLAPLGGDVPVPGGAGEIGALDLARALRSDAGAVRIFDVRGADAREAYGIPRAEPVDPDVVTRAAARGRQGADVRAALGLEPGQTLVLVGDSAVAARALWLELRRARLAAVRYMPDGVSDWVSSIVSPVLPAEAGARARAAFEEQAELSRYFGGFPRIAAPDAEDAASTAERIGQARRRGCAF